MRRTIFAATVALLLALSLAFAADVLDTKVQSLDDLLVLQDDKTTDLTKERLSDLAVDDEVRVLVREDGEITVRTLKPDEIGALLVENDVDLLEVDQEVALLDQEIGWNVERVNATNAWGVTTGSGVTIAILDTGVGPHEDLDVEDGWDVTTDTSDYSDDNGHGTLVAGVVGAKDNSIGIVGVSPDATLLAVKIFNGSTGQLSDVLAGVEWARANDADIIVMSFALEGYSQLLRDELEDVADDGILLVAAAGNDGSAGVRYPAAYDSVIAVGATDETDTLASFSSIGPELELVAPGVDVTSTALGDAYEEASGTSLAAPHVAGVAALLWSANSSLSAVQVRARLRNGALDLGDTGLDEEFGYGLVQASLNVSNDTFEYLTYAYEVYNITNYDTENETITFWFNSTGTIDDIDFEPGYYLVTRHVPDAENLTLYVNENGTVILLVTINYDDEWTTDSGSSTDGKVWTGSYYIKVKTSTSSQVGECWQWDSSTSDYDQCYFTSTGNRDACNSYYCDVGVPCTVGGVASFHTMTSGMSSIARKEVQMVTLDSACHPAGIGDKFYYAFNQKRTVCSGTTYRYEGKWSSTDWSSYSSSQSCESGSSCDSTMDEYTCGSESCTPQSPCRRNEGQTCDHTDGSVTNDCFTGLNCTGGTCVTTGNETTDLMITNAVVIQVAPYTDLVANKTTLVRIFVLNNGSYQVSARVRLEVYDTLVASYTEHLSSTQVLTANASTYYDFWVVPTKTTTNANMTAEVEII